MQDPVEFIATNIFTHKMADGRTISWCQEDEGAAKSKEEAVAIVQRTIDFWITKLASDLTKLLHKPIEETMAQAETQFRQTFETTLDQAFTRKWGMTMDDFTFKTLT